MFAYWLAVSYSAGAAEIQSLNLNIKRGKDIISNADLKPGEVIHVDLNENSTMSVNLVTTFIKAPRNHVIVMECGAHSISFPMNYKNGRLSFEFTPQRLSKLYKYSGLYNLKLMVADKSLEKPLFLNVAKVNFIADGREDNLEL